MARPPARGMGSRCTFRALGTSTMPSHRASRAIGGVIARAAINAAAKERKYSMIESNPVFDQFRSRVELLPTAGAQVATAVLNGPKLLGTVELTMFLVRMAAG